MPRWSEDDDYVYVEGDRVHYNSYRAEEGTTLRTNNDQPSRKEVDQNASKKQLDQTGRNIGMRIA